MPPPVLPQPGTPRSPPRRRGRGVRSLHPADADEARLAVRIVLAGAHICLRNACAKPASTARTMRKRAGGHAAAPKRRPPLMRAEGAAERALAQQQKKMRLATRGGGGCRTVPSQRRWSTPRRRPRRAASAAAAAHPNGGRRAAIRQAAIAPSPVRSRRRGRASRPPVPLAVAPPAASLRLHIARGRLRHRTRRTRQPLAPPPPRGGVRRLHGRRQQQGSAAPRPPAATGSHRFPHPRRSPWPRPMRQQNLVAAAQDPPRPRRRHAPEHGVFPPP